jgi:hypothetical protein
VPPSSKRNSPPRIEQLYFKNVARFVPLAAQPSSLQGKGDHTSGIGSLKHEAALLHHCYSLLASIMIIDVLLLSLVADYGLRSSAMVIAWCRARTLLRYKQQIYLD